MVIGDGNSFNLKYCWNPFCTPKSPDGKTSDLFRVNIKNICNEKQIKELAQYSDRKENIEINLKEQEIKFGNKSTPEENLLYLPDILNLKNTYDYINIRAFADSESLKIKYTDKKTYLENKSILYLLK